MTHTHSPVSRMSAPAKRRGGGRPRAEKARGLRERAWWLMRKLPRFTVDDLLCTLADGGEADAPGNLRKYVRGLEKVGVLARLMRRQPANPRGGTGAIIYRMARDLGRDAPVWRRDSNSLYDPNSGALIAQPATAPAPAAEPPHQCLSGWPPNPDPAKAEPQEEGGAP